MASQVDVAPAGGAAAARRVWHPADGETPLQMTHAWAVKEQGRDTSQDQPWDVDWWLAGAEVYVYALSGLWLVPKVLVFVPLLFLLQWPAVFVIWVYGMSFQWSTDAVDRTTGGFRVMVALFWLLFLPAALVAFLSYLLDCVVYYLFGVLYCTLTFGWCRLARSFRALAPYRGGPGLLWHFTDVIVALTGQCIRNGLLESTWKMSVMWTVLPWLKYWINANPFVYDLSERFVQQITTSMQDMALEEVAGTCRKIISRTKPSKNRQQRVDTWSFIPHYPYPPPGRRWAYGMQSGGNWFYLLVHTTHADADAVDGVGREQFFVLSNSCARPIYRVMLWYSNPYHFFTGFVEAQVSNGQPAQLDKRHGGEHPMWLVASHSPANALRGKMLGVGWIDHFFDTWLPTIVDEIRWDIRGAAPTAELHSEVISKDGISRPASGIPVPTVEELESNVSPVVRLDPSI